MFNFTFQILGTGREFGFRVSVFAENEARALNKLSTFISGGFNATLLSVDELYSSVNI